MEYLTIENVRIKKTAALAPMAGAADYAYRTMVKQFGASYLVGEMVSCKGLVYNDKKSAALLSVSDDERPMAVQLFGADPVFMAEAAKISALYKPDIIDINSGCPVPKVSGNGAGAALLKTPKLLESIIKAVVNSVSIPVTVKIRSGWDSNSINAVEIAKLAENAGVAAITIHARTKEQLYGGKANWQIIADIKNAVKIPVIGNGDVRSLSECLEMYNQTGCDLVMIGRGSYGNPWLFREIEHYFLNGEKKDFTPDLNERLSTMISHIELLINNKGEKSGIREARKVAGWYLKGLQGAAGYRYLCGKMSVKEDLYKLAEKVKCENMK